MCILSDSNIGLSGNLVAEEGWNYYEVKSLSVKCDNNFQCDNGKCINTSLVSLFLMEHITLLVLIIYFLLSINPYSAKI